MTKPFSIITLRVLLAALIICMFALLVDVTSASSDPTLNIALPINGTIYNTNSVNVYFSVNVPPHNPVSLGVDFVTYYLDSQPPVTLQHQPSMFALSNLTEGTHNLQIDASVAYYGVWMPSREDAIGTVTFTIQLPKVPTPINSTQPTITPSVTALPTTEPTTITSVQSTETPSASPSIPEFSLTAVAISFLTVTVLVGVFFRRKQLRGN